MRSPPRAARQFIRGIGFKTADAIAMKGNLVAIERAGIEAKEFGNYLFGEIDVPALEKHSSPIEPYDPTRSLQLNPRHPVVAVLLGFIGSKLEEVTASLVRRSKEARKTEQARRLAMEADKIAQILNDDFRKISDRLHEIRAASSAKGRHKHNLAPKQPVRELTIGCEVQKRLVLF